MREEHQQEVDEAVHKYETMLKAADEFHDATCGPVASSRPAA
jgi:hypothetical protein